MSERQAAGNSSGRRVASARIDGRRARHARCYFPLNAMQVNSHVARKQTSATPVVLKINAKNQKDLLRYFEYSQSGVEVVEDGLKEVSFGEYLVEQGIVTRFQLFRALQMQDRLPGVRLGECAAALGYAPIAKIEKLYAAFTQLHTVMIP